jgi:hypothetical protein
MWWRIIIYLFDEQSYTIIARTGSRRKIIYAFILRHLKTVSVSLNRIIPKRSVLLCFPSTRVELMTNDTKETIR